MSWKKLTPNLMVEDVDRTVDFYSNVLGFEFVMGVPEKSREIVTAWNGGQVLDYAMMKRGNAEIMFQARRSLAGEIAGFKDIVIGGSLCFYFEVEDVEGLYAKIKDEATVVRGLQVAFYGMKEFYIRDCNGYILTFAQQT